MAMRQFEMPPPARVQFKLSQIQWISIVIARYEAIQARAPPGLLRTSQGRKLPARIPPGGKAAGNCRQEFSPGGKLPEIAGKKFPRGESCRQLPARNFPGGKAAGNCRQEISRGKKLPTIAGKKFPRGEKLPEIAGGHHYGTQGVALGWDIPGFQPGKLPDFPYR
jgi:hypothetical protein